MVADAPPVPVSARRCLRDHLGDALEALLRTDEKICLLGEDIVDPYGGAFKVTRGLSSRYPDRVRSTPVSEAGILGLATGMSLAGWRPVVEVMFGDFLTLGFDQLFNHAAKFPRMYNGQVRCPVVVRTATGGGRGYGPTHSQCPEKYFLGVPGVAVTAANLHAAPLPILRALSRRSQPSLFVEGKTLYDQVPWTARRLEEVGWLHEDFELGGFPVRLLSLVPPEECALAVVAYGSMAHRLERVLFDLAVERELFGLLVCPVRLNPEDLDPLWDRIEAIGRVAFVEEGTAGWGWGSEWAVRAQQRLHGRLQAPPLLLASRPDVIPCGVERERETLRSDGDLRRALEDFIDGR